MKKFLIILFAFIGVTLVLYALILLPRYRFGYMEDKRVFSNTEANSDIIKLDNGKILSLGKRAYQSPAGVSCNGFITHIEEYPFEFYDQKTDKVTKAVIKDKIMFKPKGIALDNGKFLLTFAHNAEDKTYPKGYDCDKDEKPPYLYDSVAVVDSRTMKVEKLIKKKTGGHIVISPNSDNDYALLGNGKVLYFNSFEGGNAEIFDIEKGTSKILKNVSFPPYRNGRVFVTNAPATQEAMFYGPFRPGVVAVLVIPKEKDKALVFGLQPLEGDNRNVFEYDDKTESLTPVGETGMLEDIIKKVNKNEIVIEGDCEDGKENCVGVYDIEKNETRIVGNLPKKRAFDSTYGAKINDRYFAFAGGHESGTYYSIYYQDSHILDLKTKKLKTGPKFPNFTKGSSKKVITLDKGGILLGPYGIFHPWKK